VIVLSFLLILVTSLSSAAAAEDVESDSGFLIHVKRTGVGEFILTGATEVSRYVAPRDSGAPAEWLITVGPAEGEPRWSTFIPSALLPHIPVAPDGGRAFSFMIPGEFQSGYVRIFDERGQKLAEFALSERLARSARNSAEQIQSEIRAMRQGAQSIQSAQEERKASAKSAVLAQMRNELTRSSAALEPDMEAAASGVWQDTGDLPVDAPDRLSESSPTSEREAHSLLWTMHPGGQKDQPYPSGSMPESTENRELELSRQLELERLLRIGSPEPRVDARNGVLPIERKRQPPAGLQAETAVLTGSLKLADGGTLTEGFWARLRNGNGTFDWQWVSIDGSFQFELPTNQDFDLVLAPPAPYLFASFAVNISGDVTREYTLEAGNTLTGEIVTSDGGLLPDTNFRVLLYREGDYLSSHLVQDNRFKVALESGRQYRIALSSPLPYLPDSHELTLNNDETRTFEIQRGAVLDGRLATSDGGSFVEEFWIYFWRDASNSFFDSARVDIDGNFRIALKPETAYRIDIRPPLPYLQKAAQIKLNTDDSRHFDIERGVVAGIAVFEEGGAPIRARRIELSQGRFRQAFYPQTTARLPVALRPERSATVSVLPFDSQGLMVENVALEPRTSDFDLDVVLRQGGLLSGVVRDGAGTPVPMAELRFFQDGRFFKSVEALSDGSYELLLPHGQYELRVSAASERNFWQETPATVFEMAPKTVLVEGSEQTLDPKLGAAMHTINLERFVPGSSLMRARLNFQQIGQRGGNIYSWVSGEQIRVLNGLYNIEIDYPGFPAIRLENFEVDGDLALDLSTYFTGEQAVWTGVLRDPEGRPLPEVGIVVYDAAHRLRARLQTDGTGSFEIPLGPGLHAEIGGGAGFPVEGNLIKRLVELDLPLRSMQSDIILHRIEFENSALRPAELVKVFGKRALGDSFNIIFLSDGYTDVNETFTDQNGNGLWDGVLFVDVDGNNVWNRGEPVTAYGDAAFDWELDDGTDVTALNEPFADLNGDGFPNFNDREVFESNIRNFMRALLGSHVWSETPELFNAFGFFTPSAESGSGIIDADDRQLVVRDTVFSSNMTFPRRTLSIDYSKARSVAAEALPEHDLVVVLLNQPVPMGRANSFIVYNGGMKAGSPLSRTPHHEMGHAFSFLADEYQEFPRSYEGLEPAAVNVTTFSRRSAIPWVGFLEDGATVPTPRKTDGMGLFTGGRYHQGGIFRPTENSTMRYNAPKFNAVSEKATRDIMLNRYGIDPEVLFIDDFED
jgi:hypothetical protein